MPASNRNGTSRGAATRLGAHDPLPPPLDAPIAVRAAGATVVRSDVLGRPVGTPVSLGDGATDVQVAWLGDHFVVLSRRAGPNGATLEARTLTCDSAPAVSPGGG